MTRTTLFILLFIFISGALSFVAAQAPTTSVQAAPTSPVQAAPTSFVQPTATTTIPPGSPTIPAIPTSANTNGNVVDTVSKAIKPESIVAAIICIGIGGFLCFFGYRFFRPTLFVAGFALFGFIAFIVCMLVAPLNGSDLDTAKRAVFLIIIVAVGLVGGILSVWLWRYGIVIIGALGGLVAALFILALAPHGLIQDNLWRALFIVVMAIVCGVLVYFFERPVVIIATSIAGGFGIALGIDFFVQSAFVDSIASFLGGSSNAVYSADARTYILLSLVAILAVLGMFIQFRYYKGVFTPKPPHPNHV